MATKTKAKFRNRIVRLDHVKASVLRRNPNNWREHPLEQKTALESMLEEIGYAGAAVAYEEEEGELTLVDGHLRADIADDDEVPVLVTDLTKDEADKLLATFDVVGSMAGVDADRLSALVTDMDFDSLDLGAALGDFLDSYGATWEDSEDDEGGGQRTRKGGKAELIPEMELEPQEHYDYVIVIARKRTDWHRLCALLDLDRTRKRRTKRKIGLGRVVDAAQVIEIVDGK